MRWVYGLVLTALLTGGLFQELVPRKDIWLMWRLPTESQDPKITRKNHTNAGQTDTALKNVINYFSASAVGGSSPIPRFPILTRLCRWYFLSQVESC